MLALLDELPHGELLSADQDRDRPVGVASAAETVTSMREVLFFLIRSGVAVTFTVDASWENGALRPDTSGSWSEAANGSLVQQRGVVVVAAVGVGDRLLRVDLPDVARR